MPCACLTDYEPVALTGAPSARFDTLSCRSDTNRPSSWRKSSPVHLQWVAAGEGDELVEGAGVGGHRYGWIESGGGAALRSEGLLRQAEDVSGVGVRDVEGTV